MKKLVLLTIMVFALAIGANAGTKMAGYVGGGVVMPSGDFGDAYDMGFGGVAGIGFQINPMFEVGARFGYSIFGGQELTPGFDWPDWTSLEMMGDVKFFIPMGEEDAPFSPYLCGGAGMVNSSVDLDDVESTTDFAFNFGAGFIYQFNPQMGFFVDGRYMSVSSEGDSITMIPIRAGLKINFGSDE